MTKHFNYSLTGTGWAEVFFKSDKQNIRFEFSYLSNPLVELFDGLYRIINNQSNNEKIIFPEEPGEHSLIISKVDKEKIKIEIYSAEEWEAISNAYNTHPLKELVYSDTDTIKNFILVICNGVDNLLERHSLSDYIEKWSRFEFPMEKYKRLKLSLD